MVNYIIYKSEYGEYIVELLNNTETDMLEVQRQLINQGYIIINVIDRYIKCYKVGDEK